MKRGRPPFANARKLGARRAARAIAGRLAGRFGAYRAWVLDNGGIVVRHHSERRFIQPPAEALIGTYTKQAPVEVIEGDLAERLYEIRGW